MDILDNELWGKWVCSADAEKVGLQVKDSSEEPWVAHAASGHKHFFEQLQRLPTYTWDIKLESLNLQDFHNSNVKLGTYATNYIPERHYIMFFTINNQVQ